MYAELVEEQAVQEFDDDILITDQEEETATEEFEFTADLAVELPTYVDPKQFFSYLARVMVAHTEAYGGFMGGETKWRNALVPNGHYNSRGA
ncbi:MAG: hypothetical protein ACPGWR_24515 [Ardenticatenaceae bacterium]